MTSNSRDTSPLNTSLFTNRFEGDLQYRDQLPVRLIDDKQYSKVEFRSTREPMGKNLLNKLQFKLSSLNVDSQVRLFMFVLRFNKLNVCFLFQFKDTSTSMIPCRINKIWVYKSIALKI